MIMKKICVILMLVCLLTTMTSCFIVINDPNETGSTDNTSSTEKKPYETFPLPETYHIPDVINSNIPTLQSNLDALAVSADLKGKSVTLICVDDATVFMGSEDTTTQITAAVGYRSMLLREKYSLEIVAEKRDYDTFLAEAKAAKAAGSYYADVVSIPQGKLSHAVNQNIVLNLKALYNSDFSAKWFDAASDQFAAGQKIYGVLGSATCSPSSLYCVYYNKNIAKELDLPSLYAAVDAGTWTLDDMYLYAKSAADADSGRYGVGYADRGAFIDAMYFGSGMTFTKTGYGQTPLLNRNDDVTNLSISKIKPLLEGGFTTYVPSGGDTAVQRFNEGKMLFYVDTLRAAEAMTVTYGVLPVPKTDASQENYASLADGTAPVLTILQGNTNLELSTAIVHVLNAASEGLISDAYCRDFLNRAARDVESSEMVGLIADTAKYDFAFVFGGDYATLSNATYSAVRNAVEGKGNYVTYANRYSAAVLNNAFNK